MGLLLCLIRVDEKVEVEGCRAQAVREEWTGGALEHPHYCAHYCASSVM